MKKIVAILLSLISVICIAALGACEDDKTDVTDNGTNGGKEIEAGFYTVTEAYGLGLLTREHVMSIAYYHNGGTRCNEDIMGTNYVPLPKTPYTPSKKMDAAIKESFYNSDYCGSYRESRTKEDVCYGYFGTYGNVVAVKIGVSGENVLNKVFEENVDEIIIYSTIQKRVLIWVSNI